MTLHLPKSVSPCRFAAAGAFAGLVAVPGIVNAADIPGVDLSLGAGLRTSFESVDDGAPDGDSNSKDFTVNNMRLYVNGEVNDSLGMTFNTEVAGFTNQEVSGGQVTTTDRDTIEVLDAIVRYSYSDAVNIWAGRMLTFSNRSNLAGPFFRSGFNFPEVSLGVPSKIAGRDDGVTYWGQLDGGQIKWQAGVFDGVNNAANDEDDPRFAGRLTVNFLDPEPGYYNATTYYGEKEILALGVSAQSENGEQAFAIDGLAESTFNGHTLTLEGAYYEFDGLGGQQGGILGDNGAGSDSFFISGAWLLPKTGPGQFQPIVRYSEGEADQGAEGEIIDVGVEYVVDGHDARFSVNYQDREDGFEAAKGDTLTVGAQLQF